MRSETSGNESLPFPFEKIDDQRFLKKSLLASDSYKPISSDPNSPSRSHHSSKLESLDLSSLQAFPHLSVLGQSRWQPDAACLPGPGQLTFTAVMFQAPVHPSFRLCQSFCHPVGHLFSAQPQSTGFVEEATVAGPGAKQGWVSAGRSGETCYLTVGSEDTPKFSLSDEIHILRSFYLSYNNLTSTLTCISSFWIPRQ